MFEPAGVRTLLSLRSSQPCRPATSYERRLPLFASACSGDVGLRDGDLAAAPMLCTKRPCTAPPHLPGLAETADRAESEDVEPCEEEEDDNLDEEGLLAKASTMIYQLQHKSWLEDRRSEVEGLWKQLEERYGVKVSGETAHTLQMLDAELQAELQGGGAAISGAACSSAGQAEPADSSVPSPDDDAEELEAAGSVLDASAEQLEAMRRLRSAVEARLQQHPPSLEPGSTCGGGYPEAASPARRPSTADERRLESLRADVERLREASSNSESVSTTLPDDSPGDLLPVVAPSVAGEGDSLLPALEQWVEDMRWLTMAGALPGDGSTVVGKAAQPPVRDAPTPLRRGPGSCSPLSKKELARVAEERAMDWAAAKASSCGSPTKAAFPKSPNAAATTPVMGKRGLASPLSSRKLQNGSPLLTSLVVSAGGSPKGATADKHGESPARPQTAMEAQLDDILKECDEIDRIHEGLLRRKLTCA
eukprot:TRINITY_DN102619_c0_g1_i1.p1 TRINITY_DN102619_c0_g1~~TRINITY_DN102619_c0_g1_i1.p1  ORF type:complete len:478 (-),score=101.65 TRINITY_DN102619_c0_g1_i1:58-1491(-)